MNTQNTTFFNKYTSIPILLALLAAPATSAFAGSYAPAVGKEGTTAVHYSSEEFAGWASSVVDYTAGTNVSSQWQNTSLALGIAVGTSYDITCLGRGGTMTLGFDKPITNGDGWDFAVFENSFNDAFLELAYVEVSSDGENFVRFPCHSETTAAVGSYGSIDPTCIDGLASKYRQGYGTPFDLSDLEGVSGVENVDLSAITQVRIVDIVGDGTYLDSDGNIIYDPYPTTGSGGFDLDAIGVRHFLVEVGETLNSWATTWYGGVFAFESGDGWIYSWENRAWQYFSGDSANAWIYDEQTGWAWTQAACFPCFYVYGIDKWIWFIGTDENMTRQYYVLDAAPDTEMQQKISTYPYITAEDIASLEAGE